MAESKIGGRYILGEQLGRGGMATVYRAHDPQFGRDVAIKMLHNVPGDELEEFLVNKFRQEAKIIASLEHYAIVPVYDYGRHDDWPYLVMRLMDGGTLKDSILQGALPLAEIQIVLDRICAALDRAHLSNIVHRDIKPTNIFMDDEGLVYLGDFGIARITAGDQTTSYLGSPRYMAPEQAQGDPLSPATDIYQMGIVLYEMLTGTKPYSGETPEQTILMHLQQPIPRPTDIDPDLPIGMDSVIEIALAKDPADRFQSARDLAEAFRHALKSPTAADTVQYDSGEHFVDSAYDLEVDYPQEIDPLPVSKKPFFLDDEHAIQPEEDQGAFLQNNRWLLWLTVALLLAVLVCGGSFFAARAAGLLPLEPQTEPAFLPPPTLQTGGSDPISEEEPVIDAVETATLPNPPATVTIPVFEELQIDAAEIARLGGGSGGLAYAANGTPPFSIFVAQASGVEKISDNNREAYGAVYSPNGAQIAWHAQHPENKTWEIYIANADGSGQRNLTNHISDDSFPRWSPDGQTIAFHSNRNEQFDIYTIGVNNGTVSQLTNSDQNEFGPSFSSDGEKIAFHRVISRNVSEIFIINADGENEVQATSLNRSSQFASWQPAGDTLVFHTFVDGYWQLFTINPVMGTEAQVTFDLRNSFYPKWSPNGEWIAYHSEISEENRDLFLVSPDGTKQVRLTSTEEQERMPDFQP